MRCTVLAALLSILLAGCQSAKVATESTAYDYIAYDSQGKVVVTGVLRLAPGGAHVSGDWTLQPSEGITAAQVGPQVGQGQLAGSTRDGAMVLNLQPGTIDNHVVLRGRLQNKLFSGAWQYIGFGGVVTEGAFSAVAN